MTFKCLCGTTFEVDGEDSILPEHKNEVKGNCSGSNKSVKDVGSIAKADCPLGMGRDYCPACQTQPCLSGDNGDEDSEESVES